MRTLGSCMLIAVVTGLSGIAHATTITQLEPADSLANADWNVSYDGSAVRVGLRADFLNASMVNSPIVLQFILDPNDRGVTGQPLPILLVNYDNAADGNVYITNSTGLLWQDFHFVLVNVPAFLPEYAAASFGNLTGTTSVPFATVDGSSSALNFSGGTLASGSSADFQGITIDDNGADGGVFYLKLIPTPEPGTIFLLSAGILGLVRLRKSRL